MALPLTCTTHESRRGALSRATIGRNQIWRAKEKAKPERSADRSGAERERERCGERGANSERRAERLIDCFENRARDEEKRARAAIYCVRAQLRLLCSTHSVSARAMAFRPVCVCVTASRRALIKACVL